jgi:hypothetical protein
LLPYWLLFSLCAIGAIQYSAPVVKVQPLGALLLLASLAIALMIGLRYEVGGDWGSYERMFTDYRYLNLDQALASGDPAYSLLNYVAARLGAGIWLVNLVCAAIFTVGFIAFARTTPNPWLALVAAVPYLIIVVAMGYTRQAVAIGLLLAAISGLGRKSLLRFAVLVCLAASFHKSAVIVIPLVGLAISRNRFVSAGFLVGLAVAFYYAFVSASVDRLMTNYVEAEMESQGATIRVAMNLPPAILLLLASRRFGFSDVERAIWRNFSIAALVLLAILVTANASTAVDRVALYLIPLQIAVLARVPHAFGGGRRNGILTLAIIGYAALVEYVWLTQAEHALYWLPYQFYPLA